MYCLEDTLHFTNWELGQGIEFQEGTHDGFLDIS